MRTPLVGLAGDWHGDTAWALYAVRAVREAGCTELHHLGDFGVWSGPAGGAYLQTLENACAVMGLTIFVTLGNHEDYDLVQRISRADAGPGPHDRAAGPLADPGIGALGWVGDHIALLPRGHRWSSGGRSFVSLGGAPSVDVGARLPGRDWWAAEAVTDADVATVESGGRAEVFLAHDAPDVSTAVVGGIVEANPAGWPPAALAYAARGRAAMTRAFAAVRPRLYVHGHYHVADEAIVPMSANVPGAAGDCLFVALSDERTAGNLAVLDTADLTVRRLP